MSSADVDIRAVNALIALFGVEKTGQHIRDFCARVEELLPELDLNLGHGDLDELRRTAHDLNGTAGHLGFSGFSRLAERVERAVRDGDGELAPGFAAARASLHDHFPDLVPAGKGA